MALFRKKKKKKDKAKDKKATEIKAQSQAPPAPEPEEDVPLKRPEYLRSSTVDLDEVETSIDLGADKQSRSNILSMFEERYGEKLEAPEFSAGLRYEYQLYEEAEVVTERDLSFLEDGETPEDIKVQAGVPGTKPKKEKKGFFGRKPKKEKVKAGEKGVKETPTGPVEPAAPSFFDPNKVVDWRKSGIRCIFLGKPMFPITRYVRYRAREPKKWMWAIVLVDLVILPIFLSIILFRLWTRLGYEAYIASIKSKARNLDIDPAEYHDIKDLKEAVSIAQEIAKEEEKQSRKSKKAKAKKKASKADA